MNFTKEEILSMESKLTQKINYIVATEIKANMSDYEKELKLHDYIVNHTTYDYQNLLNNSVPNVAYTAFGVLINGVGVCEGYSYAMKRLLDAVGIENEVVTGEVFGESSGPHAWNLVMLNKEYYQLDVTFDDPIVNNGVENVLSHEYFNLTDAEIEKNHTWDVTKYPKCDSTIIKYKGYK
jgi:transglutaminase/protease-like cytokinesis protein 3